MFRSGRERLRGYNGLAGAFLFGGFGVKLFSVFGCLGMVYMVLGIGYCSVQVWNLDQYNKALIVVIHSSV